MNSTQKALGERLRQLRQEQGMTLKELAEAVGKSESYLSRVENGRINLSLSTLKQIADRLGRPIVHLLDDGVPEVGGQIRRGEHRRLVVSPKLEYDILSAPNQDVVVFRMRLKRGGDSGDRPYRHQGIESGLLLQGTVRVHVGDREYTLAEGDSLTYRSEEPHRFENIGDEDAIAIWCVAPPTF